MNKKRKGKRLFYFPDTGDQIVSHGKISEVVDRNGRVKIRVEEVEEE